MMKQAFRLVLAACVVGLLSACSASLTNDLGSGQPTIALHTPAANLTPTPTSPLETIASYPSNPTPKTTDNIVIYVIFHISFNGSPPRGVAGASVTLSFVFSSGAQVTQLNSQVGAEQTTPNGWAAFPLTFSGLQSQTPVLVDVTVTFHGQTYQQAGSTSFTPLAGSPPPTPKSGG